MPHPDYTLYLVTDEPKAYTNSLIEGVEAAIAGGVTMVQYRPTNESGRIMYETAHILATRLRKQGIPLIINDRLDLALAVQADGLHLGQNDLPVAVARKLLGKHSLLGLSITDPKQLEAVDFALVDYLGAGPVFSTTTKSDAAPAIGLENLAHIVRNSPIPVVAIGGIHCANAKPVFDTGVAGLAIVSALSRTASPEQAARDIRLSLKQKP